MLTYGGVRHNDHDIGIGSEDINESSKAGISHFHALKLRLQFAANIKQKKNYLLWLKMHAFKHIKISIF